MCSPFGCFNSLRMSDNDSNSLSNNVKDADDNKSIEKHMKLARKMEQKTIRILLLGPGSSGKTTILKQIKKIHCNDEVTELSDRKKITKYIKDAVIEYMKILCEQSVKLNDRYNTNTLVNTDHEHVRKELLAIESPYNLTVDIAEKIKMLWTDKGIKETLGRRQYYQIHENVDYFFDRINVISQDAYVPSFDDYLRFRQRSTGFSQTKIQMNISNFGQHTFEFTDVGGQRSERSKWMKFISEDINAVLYILAISDYDLTLFEDNTTNRLIESINLFKNIMIKGKFFKNKSVLLFFNKYDLFKDKIKETPITVAFDDFPSNEMNPNDADDVVRFVAGKFLKVFQDENVKLSGPLHIVRTTALDTNNIEKIFSDITLDLVQQNLRNLNLL